MNWDKRQIVFEIFKCSALSGGSYLDPGETLVRLVVANHYNEKLNLGIDYQDLIFLQGVSHGIGTMFTALCDERVEFLKPGDNVLISSPVYSPYNTIMENNGLKTFSIPIDPETGNVIGNLDEILAQAPANTRLICLIDPNNPTGFTCGEEFLEKIAKFAREKDCLIVSDEVYSDFFLYRKKTIIHYARERSIMICGMSKIERTGLRFGEFIIPKKRKNISVNLMKGI